MHGSTTSWVRLHYNDHCTDCSCAPAERINRCYAGISVQTHQWDIAKMFKQLLSFGVIGSLLLNRNIALAGRTNGNMVGSDGAFVRVECWSRNGKTTLNVNVIPNSWERPVAYVKFDVAIGNRRETVESPFIPQSFDANASKEIDGMYGDAVFKNGLAFGYTTNNFFYQFKQLGELTVGCGK